jgi:hypothetical protein
MTDKYVTCITDVTWSEVSCCSTCSLEAFESLSDPSRTGEGGWGGAT